MVSVAAMITIVAVSLTGCAMTPRQPAPTSASGASPQFTPTSTPTLAPPATPTLAPTLPTPAATPTPTPDPDPIAGLSLAQRVGQLFMVGTHAGAAQAVTLSAVSRLHVGNIFLSGRSFAGVAATAAVVRHFTSLVTRASTGGVRLFVATDQEGGEVQVLRGPGFSAIPSALAQGRMSVIGLTTDAARWGHQLAAAGVNMDLAPVADLVPSPAAAADNPPIGGFNRQYGYSPKTIEVHATAFRRGMRSAGITTVVKHFPGLGFVTRNTDTARRVTDTVTNAHSASVAVFGYEIRGGASCVMVSSAVYSHIDPRVPAVFSPTVVQGLLRSRLGFHGLIISDDLSAAAQVQAWSPADRAIMAIKAGVDMVLVSANPSVAAQMVHAVVTKARSDPAFDHLVNEAARRVVALKHSN